MTRWATTLFALAIFASPLAVRAQEVGLDLNTRPASFTLENIDGKPVDLGQYIGKKPVIMEFWAHWCSVCKALEPEMNRAFRKYGKQVEFLTIGVGVNQTVRSIKRHMTDHSLPGQVLWDPKGVAVRALMAPGTSYIVVLDKTGKVAYTGFGAEQSLESVLARVSK
jgi:thiol-disulfide isomerase/thioredoxin